MLDGAHRAALGFAADEIQPARLRAADAVLGRDRAAFRGGEAQHLFVDGLVVGLQAEQIDVQVAVADVAEDRQARGGRDLRDARSGTATSSLCGTPSALIAGATSSR